MSSTASVKSSPNQEARVSNRRKPRLYRVLKWSFAILVTVALLVALTGVWLVRRAWPTVSGTVALASLTEPVEVRRDTWGVPHIFAQNAHDLFFAQGYAHAQDRTW